jgi:hypothetical protein
MSTHVQTLYRLCVLLWVSKFFLAKQRNKYNWYGRPKSLLAQNFVETLKTRNEPVFKNTQEKIFPETLKIRSMVANSVVGGNPSYGLSI